MDGSLRIYWNIFNGLERGRDSWDIEVRMRSRSLRVLLERD